MRLPHGYTHPVTIGTGSFSTVVRARQEKLDRPVALKMIRTQGRSTATAIEKEARLLASVLLPCAPRIYDILRHGSTVTLVMEWIYGITLSMVIGQSSDSRLRSAIAAQMIHALAQLHRAGVAHRDLKPDNIIVTPDRGIIFVDFGFSTVAGATPPRESALRGTPRYMAPELWTDGNTVDFFRADRYSLGMVLKELFNDDTPQPVEELLRSDPADRPGDSTVFERHWLESTAASDPAAVAAMIAPAAAEYTSRLFVTGAQALTVSGQPTEAYSLLTEAIDLWPDNHEAITLLSHQFSTPLQPHRWKQWFIRCIAAAGFAAALIAAYVYGTRTTRTIVALTDIQIPGTEELFLTLPISGAGQQADRAVTAMFRDGTTALTGTIRVLHPSSNTGVLHCDGRITPPTQEISTTLTVDACTHRVEWFDSSGRCRAGETIDVLPFATTTVSLRKNVTYD
ncbi:MAG: serine/threonine protein kinase [Chitinispirillaceae bacterium]|nr:serine/threonine protein kinase [Chitinispirillaceae bacterium]